MNHKNNDIINQQFSLQNTTSVIDIKQETDKHAAFNGENITYIYTIMNKGVSKISDIHLVDDIGGNINLPKNILLPGESMVIRRTYKISGWYPSNHMNNTAKVTGLDMTGNMTIDTDQISIIILQNATENATIKNVTAPVLAEGGQSDETYGAYPGAPTPTLGAMQPTVRKTPAAQGAYDDGASIMANPQQTVVSEPINLGESSGHMGIPVHSDVTVDSEPDGAWIYLNGINESETTPANLEIPKPGSYTISLIKKGYRPCEKNCEIRYNTGYLSFDLERM